jgi:transcriptional regulator with XRE-family HTH domain
LPNYRWSLTAHRPKPGYPKQINSLGDHLKVRRLDLGLTQKAVAAELAVDPDSVRNWEVGRTSIDVRNYPALIAFLGYNPLPIGNTPGEAIRRERMTRGWSRKGLAAVAGVDEATVSRVEADTKGTARNCWKRIRRTLKLS